jgi:hypothetical protein
MKWPIDLAKRSNTLAKAQIEAADAENFLSFAIAHGEEEFIEYEGVRIYISYIDKKGKRISFENILKFSDIHENIHVTDDDVEVKGIKRGERVYYLNVYRV